jgi:hypothetical protein
MQGRINGTNPDDPAMTIILISPPEPATPSATYSFDAHACYSEILIYLTAFHGMPAFSRSFPPLDSEDGILLLYLHG